jgi:uncharacterized protein YrzB (UPF0473 family)
VSPNESVHYGSESGEIPLYNNDEDHTAGGMAADETEKADLIEGVDEDGNTILLEVIRYFFYNGDEYVILGDVQEADDGHDHCDCGHEDCAEEVAMELYVMKVVPSEEDDDTEEFVPVEDEDLLEQLIRVAEATFDEDTFDGDEN